MSLSLDYRDILKEIKSYLADNDFDKYNIYISNENMRTPWITIDYLGSTNRSFSYIDVGGTMKITVTAQLYNTNKTTTSHEKVEDDLYIEMNSLFNALKDWACRIDTVNYPYSKLLSGVTINDTPVTITNPKTTQVVRAHSFEMTFKYIPQNN